MDYNPTLEFKSQHVPGLVYVLRKMSHKRRITLNTETAAINHELEELDSQIEQVTKELTRAEEAARLEPCSCSPKCAEATFPPDVVKLLDEDRHLKVSSMCPVPGCGCRQPKPDESIGSYASQVQLNQRREL